MGEFDGSTQEDLHRDVNAYLRPDETPAESAKELADNTLRVNFILKMKSDQASPEDRNFLAAEIRKGLASL
jgi:hypothetical protein